MAVSVRLNDDARRALDELTRGGATKSQPIRDALGLAARVAWYEKGEADAKRLARDPHDRAVTTEIRAFFS